MHAQLTGTLPMAVNVAATGGALATRRIGHGERRENVPDRRNTRRI